MDEPKGSEVTLAKLAVFEEIMWGLRRRRRGNPTFARTFEVYTPDRYCAKRGCRRDELEGVLAAEWREHDFWRVLDLDGTELSALEAHVLAPEEILLLSEHLRDTDDQMYFRVRLFSAAGRISAR